MKSNQCVITSANYRGFQLKLAKGALGPVILVINHGLTDRPDGVIEIVANPRLAKQVVDRNIGRFVAKQRKQERHVSLKDSQRILDQGAALDLQAAMMGQSNNSLDLLARS